LRYNENPRYRGIFMISKLYFFILKIFIWFFSSDWFFDHYFFHNKKSIRVYQVSKSLIYCGSTPCIYSYLQSFMTEKVYIRRAIIKHMIIIVSTAIIFLIRFTILSFGKLVLGKLYQRKEVDRLWHQADNYFGSR